MEEATVYFSPKPSPLSNIKPLLKSKRLILIICLSFIILLSAGITIYQNSQFPAEKTSSLDLTFKDAYGFRRNEDGSLDYFIKGSIEKIVEKSTGSLSITLRSIAGNSMGKLITFSLPKVPPKFGSDVLGKDFEEMYNRGFHTVNMRISFDKNGGFNGWELLQKITN